jgi:hypothetical protein
VLPRGALPARNILQRSISRSTGLIMTERFVPVYELEKIATIEVGPDKRAGRRFKRNYWIARALFTLVVLIEAALCVGVTVLAFEFQTGVNRILTTLWAIGGVCTLLRLALTAK